MRGVQGAASRGVALARQYLVSLEPDSQLHDVSDDPRFQHRGVDLLWECPGKAPLGIEVKADRNARRGNFFFELVSNFEKDTPGCFLYSEADLLVYVFIETREVHCLPLSDTRTWFLAHASDYELRHTQTRTGPVLYTTVGAIVPVSDVVSGVRAARRAVLDV